MDLYISCILVDKGPHRVEGLCFMALWIAIYFGYMKRLRDA